MELRKELLALIKQRKIDLEENKASPTQNLLSHMLMATDDQTGQHLEDIYIANNVVGLLMAGLNPSTSIMTSLLRYLSELPHIYNQVLKEHLEIVKSKKPGELLN
ncbi:hypothetical protein ACOSQ4_004492 [Xanthoceras sorbifolium]